MANITQKGESRELQQRTAARTYWDPFRMLSDLMWGSLGDVSPTERGQTFVPAFDVRETKDAYVFEADLPGIREQDLDISIAGNRLSVGGKRESEQREENEQYSCAERAYGSFVRTFTLPDDADSQNVKAEFRDGVLQVKIPKRPEAQPRRVTLTSARGDGRGGQQQPTGGGGQQSRGSGRAGTAQHQPRPKT